MLGPAGRVQMPLNAVMDDGAALGTRRVALLCALMVAALLSLAFETALYEGLVGGRSSVTAVRAHSPSRSHGFTRKGLLSLPLAAQGPISAALGGDSPAYRIGADGGGFRASSPAQHLSSTFSSSGVSVRSGSMRVGLSLRSVGYGSTLTSVAAVAPSARGDRVLYAHPGLSEWYANGPLGLEQGFTIARAPAIHAAGRLTLAIALSGNVHASLGEGAQSITMSRAGKAVLRYTGLSATDARGHLLRSWLQLRGGSVLLHVDTTGVRFPLRIDPVFERGEELVGSDVEILREFGASVALSSNGTTAIIGAERDDEFTGGAWVFTRTGSTWSQQGPKLTGAGESGPGRFGVSVALSGDGNTVLVGAPQDNEGVGAVWVFTRSGGSWMQQGTKLVGAGTEALGSFGVRFGQSVALSNDGNTALIGGPENGVEVGAAWVFVRSGTTWSQQGEKIVGSGRLNGEGIMFGASVALSSNGNTALIGAPDDDDNLGAAWVFTRSGETWTQQGEQLAPTGDTSKTIVFGSSVALSGDGDTALIGGPNDDSQIGAAWFFTRSEEAWSQDEKLTPDGDASNLIDFGASVALSENGNVALVGGPDDSAFTGAVWAYERSGPTWMHLGSKLTDGEPSSEALFGAAAALSGDGSLALIGAPAHSGPTQSGAAWAFTTPVEEPPSPELGRCAKAPAEKEGRKTVYKGGYTTSTCLTASPTQTGKYEWLAGVTKTGFVTVGSTSVKLETLAKAKLKCTSESGEGFITSAKTVGSVIVRLKGCESSGHDCSTTGLGEGDLESAKLEGVLGWEAKASGNVALDLYPVGKMGPFMRFSCNGISGALSGSVIAAIKADKMAVTTGLKFKASKGKQEPEALEGGERDVLLGSLGGGNEEQAGLTLTMSQTYEEAVEINTAL